MAAALLFAAAASAAYPDKPLTIVQGFNAGGNADVIARIVGSALAKELGQPVIVDPKPGAGGNMASAQVAKAAADGYTLILMTGGHAVSAAMYKRQPFDAVDGFEWISLVSQFPFVLASRAAGPWKDLPQVLAAARKAPGEISFSSVGIGSTQHLSGELLQTLAGVKLNHIPYKGGSAPLQDVLGGRVDLMFDSVTVTRAQVEGGALRALGVTASTPAPQLPGVAPIAETVPGYEVTSWTALAAPKGLPEAVVRQLNGALRKVLADPAVVHQLEATGGVVKPTSPAETRAFVAGQVAKWKKVVADAAIPQE
jgi:tripartite-type tricarboxylate transporter receptor subunit TctC